MSKYSEVVKEDTPRLIVKFRIHEDGKDDYEWGVIGQIPLLQLVGAVLDVQAEMCESVGWQLEVKGKTCPDQQLVIVYDKSLFSWFVHRDYPKYGMLGMLDIIRATLVDTIRATQAQQQQAQPRLIVPATLNPLLRTKH